MVGDLEVTRLDLRGVGHVVIFRVVGGVDLTLVALFLVVDNERATVGEVSHLLDDDASRDDVL